MNPIPSQPSARPTAINPVTPPATGAPSPVDQSGDAVASPRTPLDQQPLFAEFSRIIGQFDSADEFLRAASGIISKNSDCIALWVIQADEQGAFRKVHSITDENAKTVWDLISTPVCQLVDTAVRSATLVARQLETGDYHQAVCVPVITGESEVQFVLAGCFSIESQTAVRQQWLMGAMGQVFTAWLHKQNTASAEIKTKSLNDAISLIQALNRTTHIGQASMAIVNHLRRLCSADQVSLSFLDSSGKGQLVAISDVEQIDQNSESGMITNSACNQAIVEDRMLVFPPTEDGSSGPELLPLEQYCKANRLDGCVNLPLVSESGKKLGAILIAGEPQKLSAPNFTEYISRMTSMVASHLEIVLKANRSFRQSLFDKLKEFKHRNLTRNVLIGAAIISLVLCIPLPYRVGCDCEVQPVMRRFISAPYSGILESTSSANGDIVEADQVLARMDGRQLRIELAGVRAQFDGAQKRHDSALAKRDFAAAQIARTEMDTFQAEIDVLDQKLINLEIKSPIDGIIVNGDLEQVEGAPLDQGQTLFEVGPLDEMLAEIAIPESEIQYVEKGMSVKIKLNSFPFQTWTGTIEQIHPGTEIIEDEAVFIARVRLPNEAALLRPGLKGTAKVSARWSPLGWNLFHRPWESIRYWMIW